MENENNKLRIAFDAKRLFNNFTGLGNYSRSLVKKMQQFYPNHEYHLFTTKATKNVETEYFFDSQKFTIHTPTSWKPFWRTFGMATDVNAINPDIFHGLSHEIPFGLDPNIATVITFHDLIYEIYPKQFGLWDRNLYHFKYRSSAKRTQFIIAISESTKKDLMQLYDLEEDKITVLYQSCSDVFMDEKPLETINNDMIPVDLVGYYLYVGSIIERKGLLQIIMAYAQLPAEYRKPLVIVGKGDKSYIQKVEGMIQYYNLESNIVFVHGMTNQQLVQVYDNSFCLIYPSVYEGFGIPVIESLFRNKPVITSDLSSLPEAAGPGAILVNPYDIKELTQAMIDLHSPLLYDHLRNSGHHYVQTQFAPEKTTLSLQQFYQMIASKSRMD